MSIELASAVAAVPETAVDLSLIGFKPIPDVPPDAAEAARSGELVVFVGAGISRLIGCPDWHGFADRVLAQFVPESIDFYGLSQIETIKDPKKKLSIAKILSKKSMVNIDFEGALAGRETLPNIYNYLNQFNCAFVTTNYDRNLKPSTNSAVAEDKWRFHDRGDLLGSNLDKAGNVLHLHGCEKYPDGMIITTKEYLEHYSNKGVQEFLQDLFERKTVIFLGYGLEEIELLEYIFKKGSTKAVKTDRVKRYILQGFFDAEHRLYELLSEYYAESFNTELLAFPKDRKGYKQQVDIIEDWAKKLKFGGLALADEVTAMEDEIGD